MNKMNGVQQRAWDHLTNGSATRSEGLALLVTTTGFFQRSYKPSIGGEQKALADLTTALQAPQFSKFCKPGIDRLLAAAKPAEKWDVVLEVRVPITESNPSSEFHPELDKFGDGSSLSGFVATRVSATLSHGVKLNLGDSVFRQDGTAQIVGVRTERRKP